MFCKICLKYGKKKNTMTSKCKTFKTSSITRHEELMDHKHAVSAGEFSANFEAAVSKAFFEEILSSISTEIDEKVMNGSSVHHL